MARHVRVRVAGGMYHVCSRGDHRGLLFCHDEDVEHFLGLLREAVERYRMRVYAYCFMPNHYHLLVGTPAGNISQVMKWLNGSYGIWFNKRHDITGHVFGERFKAVLIENAGWLLEARVYVHMNCVATEELGLGKAERSAQRSGLSVPPIPEEVEARLKKLRDFRRSSYRGYAGYERIPEWLTSDVLLKRVGEGEEDQSSGYRAMVEDRIRQGVNDSSGLNLKWGLVLGGERFARKVRKRLKPGREIRGKKEFGKWISFEEIVRIVERLKDEKWEAFRDKRGDTGRDLALWACRKYGGMSLREAGVKAGGMDYSAVAVSVLRFERRAENDRKLRKIMSYVAEKCQK
jgi:REP element-mobilizing transposase RayT